MSDLKSLASKLVADELTNPTIHFGNQSSAEVFGQQNFSPVEQVFHCLRFLSVVEALAHHDEARFQQPKTPKRIGVYHAKHVVEKWCGRYITTHAFITAAKAKDGFNLRLTSTDQSWGLPAWIYRLLATIKHSDDFRPLLAALVKG